MNNIIHLNTIDSTNRYAKDLFAEFADNTLVTADSQTAGRGRRGRTWFSPPGMNLYASYIVKNPSFPAGRVLWCGGLAALSVLQEYCSLDNAWLKWPNDICCSSPGIPERYRKIAGLLAETTTYPGSSTLDGVIAGIGINLNMPPELLEQIDKPATSVFTETGYLTDSAEFAEKLLDKLVYYRTLAEERPDEFFGLWRDKNGLAGKMIVIRTPDGGKAAGTVTDVTPDGALVLTDESGVSCTVTAGDVYPQ